MSYKGVFQVLNVIFNDKLNIFDPSAICIYNACSFCSKKINYQISFLSFDSEEIPDFTDFSDITTDGDLLIENPQKEVYLRVCKKKSCSCDVSRYKSNSKNDSTDQLPDNSNLSSQRLRFFITLRVLLNSNDFENFPTEATSTFKAVRVAVFNDCLEKIFGCDPDSWILRIFSIPEFIESNKSEQTYKINTGILKAQQNYIQVVQKSLCSFFEGRYFHFALKLSNPHDFNSMSEYLSFQQEPSFIASSLCMVSKYASGNSESVISVLNAISDIVTKNLFLKVSAGLEQSSFFEHQTSNSSDNNMKDLEHAFESDFSGELSQIIANLEISGYDTSNQHIINIDTNPTPSDSQDLFTDDWGNSFLEQETASFTYKPFYKKNSSVSLIEKSVDQNKPSPALLVGCQNTGNSESIPEFYQMDLEDNQYEFTTPFVRKIIEDFDEKGISISGNITQKARFLEDLTQLKVSETEDKYNVNPIGCSDTGSDCYRSFGSIITPNTTPPYPESSSSIDTPNALEGSGLKSSRKEIQTSKTNFLGDGTISFQVSPTASTFFTPTKISYKPKNEFFVLSASLEINSFESKENKKQVLPSKFESRTNVLESSLDSISNNSSPFSSLVDFFKIPKESRLGLLGNQVNSKGNNSNASFESISGHGSNSHIPHHVIPRKESPVSKKMKTFSYRQRKRKGNTLAYKNADEKSTLPSKKAQSKNSSNQTSLVDFVVFKTPSPKLIKNKRNRNSNTFLSNIVIPESVLQLK
ncbi:hypothetical protein BB560_000287 [Smittium megazygosporum]|uniref:Uncharacterized protein n=1 Tax=Smittium megazygosporum TaxID=133381 RepID=A0A2T9ZKQ9_9FUNG|nr:hypothetical protein BB560_000287 [Smittium megazygosporum]